ncbi:HVO_0476 family zinc finger protein [Halovenus sp. HT40]|uniref:HVO_0476 family zinc finger protein n=1 Tax=Halovenus sp. HT40 TaxID=3126691 RepID=UPI00300F065E
MSEPTERIAVACPACSPERETVHEILSPGGQATIRCTECDHVHKKQLPEEQTQTKDVVVSQDGESFSASTEAPVDETIATGEEFLLETDEAILTVRITSLEIDKGRTEEAAVEDVNTIWTRAVGNVKVNVTAHPKSGEHDETRSFSLQVPGDYEFVVDETEELGGEEFTIEGIYLRDDATGYDHEKLDFGGDAALAKDIKRLYVRDESTTAWSAW